MLSRLRNMFRVPDLRNKILFTIGIIAVYRLGAHLPVPYVDFERDQAAAAQRREQRRRRRLPRPLLGRRDHQRRHLLPRDHAVHHGVDHHAAARGRHPEARAVAERGPGRPEEDHAVDPLRHHRAGAGAVDRLRVRPAPGQERPARLLRLRGPGPHPELQRRQGRADRPHLDGGNRDGDVAGRAHHPARHRQRHVDPDLRVGGVAPPRAGLRDLEPGQQVPVLHDHRHRHRDDRRHRVRRVGAATHPSPIRETRGGPPHVRRPEHLHPAEGQPVGCDPGDLREFDPVVPRADRVGARRQLHRACRSGSTTTW